MNLSWFYKDLGVPVLMFHGLCEKIPEYALFPGGRTCFLEIDDFSTLIGWCSKNFDIMRLSELDQYLIGRNRKLRPIILTFDDGLASVIDLALPILREYQAFATIFVTTDWTDSGHTPDIFALEQLIWKSIPTNLFIRVNDDVFEFSVYSREEAPKVFTDLWNFLFKIRFPPLKFRAENVLIKGEPWKRQEMQEDRHFWFPASWEELRAASESGLIEIGSHMVSHIPLSWLSDDEKLFQLKRSHEILSNMVGFPVTACAYPHGCVDDKTITIAENIYRWGFTSKPGYVQRRTLPGTAPRNQVPNETPEQIQRILQQDRGRNCARLK